MRRLVLADGDPGFVAALSQCRPWEGGAAGGKSNAYFAKTTDDRFIIKQVSRTELNSFLAEFGPAYFAYIRRTQGDGGAAPPLPTCLARILGVFQVSSRVPAWSEGSEGDRGAGAGGGVSWASTGTGAGGGSFGGGGGGGGGGEGGGSGESSASGAPTLPSLGSSGSFSAMGGGGGGQQHRETKLDFLVMENLFYGRPNTNTMGGQLPRGYAWRTYDLKGSLRSRYTPIVAASSAPHGNLGAVGGGGGGGEGGSSGGRPPLHPPAIVAVSGGPPHALSAMALFPPILPTAPPAPNHPPATHPRAHLPASVLLDENLAEELATDPVLVTACGKSRLEASVYNDTAFLAALGVMVGRAEQG